MKPVSTLFLKGVLIVLALSALAFAIFALPEGLKTDNTGFYRPILIGMYFPIIPFLIALYQSWKLLEYIDQSIAFSILSAKSLRNIKYCGLAISGMFALGMPYVFSAADKDDAPGVVAIGLVIIFASLVISVFAAVLEKLVRHAVEIKSENDLTV